MVSSNLRIAAGRTDADAARTARRGIVFKRSWPQLVGIHGRRRKQGWWRTGNEPGEFRSASSSGHSGGSAGASPGSSSAGHH